MIEIRNLLFRGGGQAEKTDEPGTFFVNIHLVETQTISPGKNAEYSISYTPENKRWVSFGFWVLSFEVGDLRFVIGDLRFEIL